MGAGRSHLAPDYVWWVLKVGSRGRLGEAGDVGRVRRGDLGRRSVTSRAGLRLVGAQSGVAGSGQAVGERRERWVAAFTRDWHWGEQKRRWLLREVSTKVRSQSGAAQMPRRPAKVLPRARARPAAQPADQPLASVSSAPWKCRLQPGVPPRSS